MTKTGPADVGMSACGSTGPGTPVRPRPGFCERVSVWSASRDPAFARAVFPGSASFKPADRRLRPVCASLRYQRVLASHPRYGCSFDPGRDMLCIVTSPPRWLQWP